MCTNKKESWVPRGMRAAAEVEPETGAEATQNAALLAAHIMKELSVSR